ncbi:MAG: RNA polymerase sigma factor [Sedimentisphaerales bacterium]|nr:RNA polymerase sigma factor [Sedimentisphaerales bacterium]
MYSYSINPVFGINAEIVLRAFLDRVFSETVETVMDAAEYEIPDDESIDIEDVYQSRHGNHEAYKRLIERYEQAIAKIMWRFSRDKLVHEELVQDVFVEAYLSLTTFKQHAPFIHWLRKIATRVGYRYWKEQAKQHYRENFTLHEWDQVLAESPDKIESEQAGELLHRLLDQLPPRDRLVLTLRFVEGCDVAQTAYRTGWSRSMVKVQTIRAKRKLKKIFPDA